MDQAVRRIPHPGSTCVRRQGSGLEGVPLTAADRTPADQPVASRTRRDSSRTPPQAVGKGRPGLLDQMTENPLLSLFGAIIVVLLGFVLTTSNIRITETNDRITRLENRIDNRLDYLEQRIDRLEARIVALESTVAAIDRKLTALIATLGKTDEVEGALSADSGAIRPSAPLDQTADT